jgi:excisionase family DNA binding protein
MALARPGAEQEWLTLLQGTVLYGVTPNRARQMVAEGKIEAVRMGRHWRVSRKWLDAQHQEAGGAPAARDPFLGALAGGLDAETEETIRRLVREELRAAVREEIANLAAGLAAVLHPPGDELRPRRRA